MVPCDLIINTIHISDWRQFSDIQISQGSVATYLRCGGMFKYEFVADLPASLPVKDFENRLTFGNVMGKSLVSFFWLTVLHGMALSNTVRLNFQGLFYINSQMCSITDN